MEMKFTFLSTVYGSMFLGTALPTKLEVDLDTGLRSFDHGNDTLVLMSPMTYRIVDMPGNLGTPVMFQLPVWKKPSEIPPLVFTPDDLLVLDQEVPIGITSVYAQVMGLQVMVEPGEQQ